MQQLVTPQSRQSLIKVTQKGYISIFIVRSPFESSSRSELEWAVLKTSLLGLY